MVDIRINMCEKICPQRLLVGKIIIFGLLLKVQSQDLDDCCSLLLDRDGKVHMTPLVHIPCWLKLND